MKIDPAPIKDIPVFKSESIRAMGPAAQGIAAILKDAGWIKVTTDAPGEAGKA